MFVSNVLDLFYNAADALGAEFSAENSHILDLRSAALSAQADIECDDLVAVSHKVMRLDTARLNLISEHRLAPSYLQGSKLHKQVGDLITLYAGLVAYMESVLNPPYQVENLMESARMFCDVYARSTVRNS
jgi:hypothetical protein